MSTDADDTADYPPEHGSPLVSAAAMTLGRAVQVMNQRNHRGHNDWFYDGKVCSDNSPDEFKAQEAIAIAEKYERECE